LPLKENVSVSISRYKVMSLVYDILNLSKKCPSR
jgi:hypothetical protein